MTGRSAGRGEPPLVSVVVPMLNERKYIGVCLDGFAVQTYPIGSIEIIVVDAGSTDGSRAIVDEKAGSTGGIRVVDNPRRTASAAFNLGVGAARGEIVCLFSAHGVPEPTYVERSVEVLTHTDAVGVGGRYLHVGEDRRSSAIGLAMVSPFGMASPHRYASGRLEVDTISHPAYRRQALLDVGPFDETLERNSDYELNYRLRAAGGRLLFDGSISSIYRPRPSLRALGRQFWWYGRWKARVVRRHPGSLRPRHLVAPAAVGMGLISLLAAHNAIVRRVLLMATVSYSGAVLLATKVARPRTNGADPLTLAAAFPIMHAAWGAGFLVSILEESVGR